jgi:hypothetical protein
MYVVSTGMIAPGTDGKHVLEEDAHRPILGSNDRRSQVGWLPKFACRTVGRRELAIPPQGR